MRPAGLACGEAGDRVRPRSDPAGFRHGQVLRVVGRARPRSSGARVGGSGAPRPGVQCPPRETEAGYPGRLASRVLERERLPVAGPRDDPRMQRLAALEPSRLGPKLAPESRETELSLLHRAPGLSTAEWAVVVSWKRVSDPSTRRMGGRSPEFRSQQGKPTRP